MIFSFYLKKELLLYKNKIMTWKNKSAFTLVELIVVITILAILGTIAFISLQWYSADARDSSRISDINHIKTSLELFSLATWKYPLPDNAQDVTYSWSIVVWKQWTVWDTVTWNLSRNLNEKPTDPLYETEYIYSTLENGSKYEVMSVYESLAYNTPLLNNTYAETPSKVKIEGTYNWLYVKSWNYIIPTPSIITAENLPLDLNSTTIASQVIDNGTNIPNIGTSKITQSTWSLSFPSFNVYNGVLNEDTDPSEFLNAYNALLNTYSGSSLENVWIIQALLSNTTDDEKIAFTKTVVLNTTSSVTTTPIYNCDDTTKPTDNWHITFTTWTPTEIDQAYIQDATDCWYTCTDWYTWTSCEIAPLTWWRALDPNCDIEDITIWTQTWAWCNSTLWSGFEWWKKDDGTNGTISSCYNYDWTNNASDPDCAIWNANMTSNVSAKNFFDLKQPDWTNNASDQEFDTIWWKYYTWSNSPSACPTWRHVPSDAEWEALETYLNWWTNCRNSTDWWLCDGLWWNGHNAKTDTNNLANALKLPLAGYRYTDGSTFFSRGGNTFLWSSSPSSTDAYYRYLYWGNSTVLRVTSSQGYGFSVRCIKD